MYLLEYEADEQAQHCLSDRLLIINVPTKLPEGKLRELVVRIAGKVGVYLYPEDICDVFYMFRYAALNKFYRLFKILLFCMIFINGVRTIEQLELSNVLNDSSTSRIR